MRTIKYRISDDNLSLDFTINSITNSALVNLFVPGTPDHLALKYPSLPLL